MGTRFVVSALCSFLLCSSRLSVFFKGFRINYRCVDNVYFTWRKKYKNRGEMKTATVKETTKEKEKERYEEETTEK
jgi:hypothetical protein